MITVILLKDYCEITVRLLQEYFESSQDYCVNTVRLLLDYFEINVKLL